MFDADFVVSQIIQGLGCEASAGRPQQAGLSKLQNFSPEDHGPGATEELGSVSARIVSPLEPTWESPFTSQLPPAFFILVRVGMWLGPGCA